ncbi:hypothetical protein I4U23_019727 [Adineta vaga]|nr:hypothetical protein I4U23_019727 [Adineta vaga]
MIKTLVILFLFGIIDQLVAIECFTCNEHDNYCPLPLYLDGGDESNENAITTSHYDPTYACMSEQTWDPKTDITKVILRGIKHCEEIDESNHRRFCCYTDSCNKQLPTMAVKTLADSMPFDSNTSRHLASVLLIAMIMMCQYVLLN